MPLTWLNLSTGLLRCNKRAYTLQKKVTNITPKEIYKRKACRILPPRFTLPKRRKIYTII